jgi:hypothetical protein
MKGLGATLAAAIVALAGCGLLGGQLTAPDAGASAQSGSGTGGTPAPTVGTGAATGGVPGTGGLSGTGGLPGTGGLSGAGAFGGAPACAANENKGAACTDSDLQACSKTCGPERVGTKTETCLGGTYVESTCQFSPAGDYTCYAIPAAPDPACPTTSIQAGSACSIPDCLVCGGTTGYLDSTGAAKIGYCVCQAASASPVWSCAAVTAWPCPGGEGCLPVETP